MAINGLYEYLDGNPHKDAFAEMISYLSNRTTSNHVKVLAANYVVSKIYSWGRSVSVFEVPQYANRSCCGDEPSCCDLQIVNAALSFGVDNPRNVRIENFGAYLDNINMSAPNALIYFSKAVDAFFSRLDILSYFLYDLKQGQYADFYKDAVRAIPVQGTSGRLIQSETTQDGLPDTAIGAYYDIEYAFASFPKNNNPAYATFYSPDHTTVVDVISIVDPFNPQLPSASLTFVPAPGYTANFIDISIDSFITFTPDEFALVARDAINGDAGQMATRFVASVNPATPSVLTVTNLNGAETNMQSPATNVSTNFAADLISWNYYFGEAGDPGIPEIFELDLYRIKNIEDLAGRYLHINDPENAACNLYWFSVDGLPAAPPDGLPACDGNVQVALTSTWTLSQVRDAIANRIIGTSAYTSENINDTTVRFTATSNGPATDPKGTALSGFAGYYGKLIASDDTVLFTGITTYDMYINKYNELLVPYEETIGNRVYYVRALSGWGEDCICYPPCPCDSLVMQTPYNFNTAQISFNRPGQVFDVTTLQPRS